MYRICVPEELTLTHLLDWEVINLARELVEEMVEHLSAREYEQALGCAKDVCDSAKNEHDYHTIALVNLLQAEVQRCRQEWELCLQSILEARRSLDSRMGPVAAYNTAIAAYQEGLVQLTRGAGKKAHKALCSTSSLLEQSQRHWSFERNSARVRDCRFLRGWVSDIIGCIPRQETGVPVLVLPLYEIIYGDLNRTGIHCVDLSQSLSQAYVRTVAYRTVATHAVYGETLLSKLLDYKKDYVAIRFPVDGYLRFPGDRGDLLILEMDSEPSTSKEKISTQDRFFVRREDGRVEFRSSPYVASCRMWTCPERSVSGVSRLIIGGVHHGSP